MPVLRNVLRRAEIWLPALALLFYSGLFVQGELRTKPEKFNYFKELSASLLQGRLDIDCPPQTHCHDLIERNGKYYFYFPPVPAIVYIPAVVIWGRDTPDALIAACVGSMNVMLLILLLRRIRKFARLEDVTHGEILLPILWAFGTVHFYLAMQGSAWYIAQLFGQAFLLLSLILLFSQARGSLLAAGCAFAMAVYSRFDLLMGGVFVAAVIAIRAPTKIAFIRHCAQFSVIPIFATLAYLAYNYARFGNALEIGTSYLKFEAASGVAAQIQKYGKVSLLHWPQNFYAEILKFPALERKFPFISMDPHGFGMLWATPYFLLVIPVVLKIHREYLGGENRGVIHQLAVASLAAALMISLVIFSIPGYGYVQYGARYTLDFQVFLVIVFFLYNGAFSDFWSRVLLVVSVGVNFIGAVFFTKYFDLLLASG